MSEKNSEIIKVVTACIMSIGLFGAAFVVSTKLSMTMAMGSATRGSEVSARMSATPITFDQPSVVLEETSMIPLSTIREVFDASIVFDNNTQTVTIEARGVTVIMQVGSSVYTRDGERITLEAPPQILGGRLLIPAHPLAESFGVDVPAILNNK